MLVYTLLLIFADSISTTISTSSITASENKIVGLLKNTVSLRWQVLFDSDSKYSKITCRTSENSPQNFNVVINPEDSPQIVVDDTISDRFNVKFHNIVNSKYLLTIEIKSLEYDDEKPYVCLIDDLRSEIYLQVVSTLQIIKSDLQNTITVDSKSQKNLVVKMCGKPTPRLTFYFDGRVDKVTPQRTNMQHCFHYERTLYKLDQTFCGKSIKYTITDFNNTVTKYMKVIVLLQPTPVDSVVIATKNDINEITWTGPNIGICMARIYYQVKIESTNGEFIHNVTTNIFQYNKRHGGNLLICFVRTNIRGNFSQWVQGKFLKSKQPVNFSRRVIIIITTVIMISLLMVACGLLWFKQVHRTSTNNNGVIHYSSLAKLNEPVDVFHTDSHGKTYKLQKENGTVHDANATDVDQSFVEVSPAKRPKESVTSDYSITSDRRKESLPKRPTFIEQQTPRQDVQNPRHDVYEIMTSAEIPVGKTNKVDPYDTLHKNRMKNSTSVSSNEYVTCVGGTMDYTSETDYDRLERQSDGTRHSSFGSRSSGSSGTSKPSAIARQNIANSPRNFDFVQDAHDKNFLQPENAGMRGRLDSGDYNIVDSRSASQTSLYASIPTHLIEPSPDTKPVPSILPPHQIYDVIPRSNSISSNTPEIPPVILQPVEKQPPESENSEPNNNPSYQKYTPQTRDTLDKKPPNGEGVLYDTYPNNKEAIYNCSPNNEEAIYDVVPHRHHSPDTPKNPLDISITENPMVADSLYANVSELIKR